MDIQKSIVRIRYQFKTALTYISRHKSHSVFNLTGLVMGLASVFIISAWTMQELRYDRFHHQAKHIYMVTTEIKDNAGNVSPIPETSGPLAPELSMQIPQIDKAFHFHYLYGGRDIGTEDKSFKETGLAATPVFFDVLNFKIMKGSATGLDHPGSILLSQRLADKLFPGIDPINREVNYKNNQALMVKGIFKDCPMNSSLQFDFVIPYEMEYGASTNWWQLSDASFIKLLPTADPDKVLSLMKQLWRERFTDDNFDIGIISIADLRYGADFEFFNAEHGHGDRKKLFMFIGVAMLILILACLNYMILASSNALKREKEIWIRKVHGASTGEISSYFILESVLLSVIAWGIASLIAILGIRLFEDLIGIVISTSYFYTCIGFGLLISIIMVGFATGIFPAIQAGAKALVKAKYSGKPSMIFHSKLRHAFVGAQFILSIALTISGLSILRQAEFMQDFDTGYATDDIIEFRMSVKNDTVLNEVKDWLKGNPDIERFSMAGSSPVSLTFLNTMEQWRWSGLKEESHTSIFNINVDEEYLHVFQIPLMNGRSFSHNDIGKNKVLINEKLATLMRFEDPIGQLIRRGDEVFEIIGVVKDFNFQHLSNEIRPLLLTYLGKSKRMFVKFNTKARIEAGEIQSNMALLLGHPADISYIDESYSELYRGESQILAAVLFFTILCIVLSSLGLIGMVKISTAARTKEIGIRKVFGAESRSIMILQNVQILKTFLPAVFIGCALAWYIMSRWLEDYANRLGLEGWIFLFGSVIILVIALVSISFQTWKSSRHSPARSLGHS